MSTYTIKHYNIPIFIPELGCPNKCVFCNQKKISGAIKVPEKSDIVNTIENHLATIPHGNSEVEIAFFGGNFTGLSYADQENYLSIAEPYVDSGRVNAVRVSTRPDYINDNVLDLLKRYHVNTIELGAQSMDDQVLELCGRGHTADDVVKASKIIKARGFALGLQMMIGLPGDSFEKSLMTANRIIELGAQCTRIYPAIIMKETELEERYNNGEYIPLSLDEAVQQCARLIELFEQAGVKVIRVGLHPSDGLLSGESYVAGPFHTSLRELALTEIWRGKLESLCAKSAQSITVHVPDKEYNYAVGYKSQNKKMLSKFFKHVRFESDTSLCGRDCYADYC